MKIVYVHHHYWPVVGGLENVAKALAESMARLNNEVHIVTSFYGAEGKPKEEVINGVYVHRVKSFRPIYPDLTYPLEVPMEILKDADIVHGHSQNSLFTVKMIEKAKDLGTKTAMHFMAVDALNDHPNPLIRSLGPFYAKRVLKKAIALSDIKLVRSLRDQELLSKRYGVEAIFIPDGVPQSLISHKYSGDEFRRHYGIDGEYILYVGRLHPLKGLEVLINSMYYVLKNSIDLKLVVIGPGDAEPYKELAQRFGIERSVLFLGFVDEETKIGAIDGSVATVIPSICDYVEVYPMIISEAWARSKPVIATRVGGIPYRVKHMINGLLVSPKDPKALAEAIMTLMHDKELGVKLGSEGRKSILTWEEIAVKNMDAYHRLIS